MNKSFLKFIASALCATLLLTGCSQKSQAQNIQAVSLKKDTIIAEGISVSTTEAPDEIIVFVPEDSKKTPATPAADLPDEIIVYETDDSTGETTAPTVIDEYTNAQKNVIIEGEVISGDSAIDLSTLDKVYNYADVVVVGTISSVGLSQYRSDTFLPYTVTKITCQQVLKGEADKELTFSFSGGYMPAAQYVQKQVQRSKGKNSKSSFSDEQIKNGYAHIKIGDRPEFQIGKQYVLFLSREETGELMQIGSNYSALVVENGKYKDYKGKERVVAPRK